MPTLGVCTDSVLETEGPLALLALIDSSLAKAKSDEYPLAERHQPDKRSRSSSRRSKKRANFPYRFLIRPLDESPKVNSAGIYVTGKDLSDAGLGFHHHEPLTFRRARLEPADERLEAIGLGDMTIELTIRWCRFIATGQYESGGRIWWPKSAKPTSDSP